LTGDFLHDTPCQLHILPSGLSSHWFLIFHRKLEHLLCALVFLF
jgi:hypothetical protein